MTFRKLWIDNSCWNEGNASWKLKDSKVIRAELEKGADPNEGYALHEAIKEGATQSVYALVKHGADVKLGTKLGQSTLDAVNESLRWSSSEESEKAALTIASFLIKNGVDPQAQDPHGNTILHTTRNERLIELFIAKGADPAAKNKDGNTPYQSQVNALKDRCSKTGRYEANPQQVARLSPVLKAADEKAAMHDMLGGLNTAWKPSDCRAEQVSADQEPPAQKQRRVM